MFHVKQKSQPVVSSTIRRCRLQQKRQPVSLKSDNQTIQFQDNLIISLQARQLTASYLTLMEAQKNHRSGKAMVIGVGVTSL